MLCTLVAACQDTAELPRLDDRAVIVCFGNSLTYGSGANKGRDYPNQLHQLTGLQVVNAGIPGELSHQGVRRLPLVLDKYQPDLIVLVHGGNDLLRKYPKQEIKANINRMIVMASERNVAIVMMGVPEPGLILDSAKLYAELAQLHNIPIDLETLPTVLGNKHLKADLIHPNDAGYAQIAKAIYLLLKLPGAIANQ